MLLAQQDVLESLLKKLKEKLLSVDYYFIIVDRMITLG
jgi:hypothetical protein